MTDNQESIGRIAEHRMRIDQIDRRIVELLNERASEALAIRKLKPGAKMGLYDPKREEEIFELVTSENAGPLYDDNLREIYAAILKVMKEVPAS